MRSARAAVNVNALCSPRGIGGDGDGCGGADSGFLGAALVAQKTHHGQPITVLEHPGLWNGAMAGRWLLMKCGCAWRRN